jgi:uncharacterized membrane protein
MYGSLKMSNETKFKTLVLAILVGVAMAAAAFGYAVEPDNKPVASFGAACIAVLLCIVWLESRFNIVTDDVEIRAIRAVRVDLQRKIAAQASGRRRSDGPSQKVLDEVKNFMKCRS